MSRRAAVAVVLALAAAALLPARAGHAQEPASSTLEQAPAGDVRPPGFVRSTASVLAIAAALPEVRAARAEHAGSYVRAYLLPPRRWQVALWARDGGAEARTTEVVRVVLDDRTGRPTAVWTGPQVAWRIARGRPGEFGRSANSPWIWATLSLAFLLPFARPPLRIVHLDLLVLLAFGVSYAFFAAGNLDVSVPSVVPLLLYLLARALWVGLRGRRAPSLRLLLPDGALLFGLAAALAFRVTLNVVDGNVIDVGYAGVIGANRLLDGERLYGGFPPDNARGDTYGPVLYASYVPWTLLWPWGGRWDALPAAHAAALTFDLACAAGLWLAGRRLRGPSLGLLLAYLWVTFPFTLLVVNSSANDALVGALVLAAYLCAGRPIARGALAVLAGLTKFAPLALVPLVVTSGPGRLRSGLAALATVLLVMAPVALGDGLGTFADRTLAFQGDRDSPFSVWGLYELPDGARIAMALAAAALAVVVAVLPARRDPVTIAASGAAVLIALQLTLEHWFYLYLVWFLPLLLVALLTPGVDGAPARSRSPARPLHNGSAPR